MALATDRPKAGTASVRRQQLRIARAGARASRFRLTWAARWISSIGDGLVFVAFPLLATRLTSSPILIAGVAFAETVPWLLLALPAGVMADRANRRHLLTAVEIARMTILMLLGVVVLSHHLVLAELYAAAFLIAAFETLFDSATMAVIPQMVREDALMSANSRLQVAQMSGEQFIGPALGGLALAAAAAAPVLLDGVSFAASGVLVTIALRPVRRLGRHGAPRRDDGFKLQEPDACGERPAFLEQIREGLAWLLGEPRVRLLCVLNASLAFCQGLGFGILVIYCTTVLHLSTAGFGLFSAAAASGNTIGAWAAPRVHARLGAGATLLVAGITGGVALLAVGFTSTIGVAGVALALEAVAVGVGKVAILALRQRLTPIELAGRVSAAIRSTVVGAASISTLVGGGLVVAMGSRAPFAIGGVAQIIVGVFIGGALARRLAADDRDVVDLTEIVDVRDVVVEQTV